MCENVTVKLFYLSAVEHKRSFSPPHTFTLTTTKTINNLSVHCLFFHVRVFYLTNSQEAFIYVFEFR